MQRFFSFFMAICIFSIAKSQVSLTGTGVPVTITFTGFAGTGFSPTPATGQLNSNTWSVTGMSDGDLAFGGTTTSGDLARGITTGAGVTSGGLYAYSNAGNQMIWIQPGASDFTPGTIVLKVCNNSGALMSDLNIAYEIHVLNDEDRGSLFNFSYSMDNITFIPVASLNYTSVDVQDNLPVVVMKNATLTGLNIAAGNCFYLRWEGDDATGTGSRDEFGLDNIMLEVPGGAGSPFFSFENSGSSVAESAGNLSIPVNISSPASCTVEVVVDAASSAVNGSDFNATSPATLTFTAGGVTTQNFSLTIIDDALLESSEMIILKLQNVAGAGGCLIGTPNIMTIAITDNEIAPLTPCSNLFFSEYIEGSGNNKVLEIFNPTGSAINLSQYSVKFYGNGSPTPTGTVALTGTLAVNDAYLISNTGASATLLGISDMVSGFLTFNGDDAIALFNGTTMLDVIGEIGVDPGTNWTVGSGATSEFTLVRKPGIQQGQFSWATGAGEWDAYPQNTFAFAGMHSMTPCGTTCDASNTPVVMCMATDVTTVGGADGTAMVMPSGGSGSYSYTWIHDPALTSATIAGLMAGNYCVSVADVISNCNAICCATINEPSCDSIVLSFAITDASAIGVANGAVNLTVSGGATPYNYMWSNGATTEDITNVMMGTYHVTVTDNNGCVIGDSAVVSLPSVIFTDSIATVSESSANLTVTLAISRTVNCSINVAFDATESTATIGTDFTFSSPRQVNFTAIGATTRSFNIPITNDIIVENLETIVLKLEPAATNSCQIGTIMHRITTMHDDDDAPTGACQNLYISEYVEGSSSNKVLEIYNPTNTAADLSTYCVRRYNNGDSTATHVTVLKGMLAPGDVYLIADPSADSSLTAIADTLSSIMFVNGDDAVALFHGRDSIDIIGVIGEDPGDFWTVGSGATKDYTLVRKAAINQGQLDWATGATEWDVYPINDFTHLNAHSATPCAAPCTPANTPSAVCSATNTTAAGATDGTATVAVTGGAMPYQYSWNHNPALTTNTATGLAAGTYCVTVTDVSGCSASCCAVVADPASCTPCPQPTNVLRSATANTITLTWDPALCVERTQIQYRVKPGQTGTIPNVGTTFANAPAVTKTFNYNTSNCGKVYQARVRHICSADGSLVSTWRQIPIITTTCARLSDTEEAGISLYPNPVGNELTVSYTASQESEIKIAVINIIGETVDAMETVAYEGRNEFYFNTENFVSGLYLLHIYNGETLIATEKFVVNK